MNNVTNPLIVSALARSTTVPVVQSYASSQLSRHTSRPRVLEMLFNNVRLNLVPFNAQDIYQVCTVAFNADTIGMTADAEFMRGIAEAFERSNQTVLSPFQVNLITDTLRRAGIQTSAKEVAIPEEDAISPESLLDVLRAMNVTRTRDERKMDEVLRHMLTIIEEFNPQQCAAAVVELGKLRCTNTDFLARLAKRAMADADQLSALDISLLVRHLALSRGVPFDVMRQAFMLAEASIEVFQPEDYLNVMVALQATGGQYRNTFCKFVEAGLERVENLDALTLTHYLLCFPVMDYRNREHIEIIADALVDIAQELKEDDLVSALVVLRNLNLLGEELFTAIMNCLQYNINLLAPRNIFPVMEVCSTVPHNTDDVMRQLMDRAVECTRVLTPHQLAEIIDVVSLYPPARDHPLLLEAFGRQARLRLEIMGPLPLAMATRGLARLGYADAEYYQAAAETGFRFGYKDWSFLEPILMGLCLAGQPNPKQAKIMASYVAPMARSMTVAEIQRANQYLTQLHCEEEFVFRMLANRLSQFVKEVTPEVPQDLQLLLQRASVRV